MRDLDYLKLLARSFPTKATCRSEIINLNAILGLPKGTEYFFSDIHGEDKAFIHLLRSSSGVIRGKINNLFSKFLPESELQDLANLIYYPERVLSRKIEAGEFTPEWQSVTIFRLIKVCREVSMKYTRSKVRKKMPKDYAYILDEMLTVDESGEDKDQYFKAILDTIVDTDGTEVFIKQLCDLIHVLSIDQLHILGDLFDRGPHPDIVIEELKKYPDVDFVWGNHDAGWLGAACGNEACMFNILRISTRYNNFDMLQDGYGINLRALSLFADEVYRDDPCELFKPHILDENQYDDVDPILAAKMQKASAVIQFKLEGQLIKRHPEYHMDGRLLLDKIDFEHGTITIDGVTYEMMDKHFPTICPDNPYVLSKGEEEIVNSIRTSFKRSVLLHDQLSYVMSHGALYRIINGNLLCHGCVPMNEDGSFEAVDFGDGPLSGKELFDYLNDRVRLIWSGKDPDTDLLWYLWNGPASPLYGKDKMATFEGCFIDNEPQKKEKLNPYYRYIEFEDAAKRILEEFGIDPSRGHIINGHIPVRSKDGEHAMKAGGRVFIIDGGLAKSYHEKTGNAGYTLIINSHTMSLASHQPFEEGKETSPHLDVVEYMNPRTRVKDTDLGKVLRSQAEDLQELLNAYATGLIRETKPKHQ